MSKDKQQSWHLGIADCADFAGAFRIDKCDGFWIDEGGSDNERALRTREDEVAPKPCRSRPCIGRVHRRLRLPSDSDFER